MADRVNVLYLTNIPSPYMVGYLNELGKYCSICVVFEKAYDSTRPESWRNLLENTNFQYHILNGMRVTNKIYGDKKMQTAPDDKALSFKVCKYISRDYDFIISCNPCTPTGMIAIAYMQIKNIPYSIQSEGGFPGSGKGIKEWMKYCLMHKAKFYFSTCDMDDLYFIKYGAEKEQIRRYPFASIYEKDLPTKMVNSDEKRKIKEKLGITEKLVILYVGRSVYFKGVDILLKAYGTINIDAALYCIGGKCTEEYQRIIEEYNTQGVHFVDNIEFSILKQYYMAADVFVLPTRNDTWGLVINEAMTYGLPIITTDMCVAGNALIKNKVNGFIIKSESVDELADAIQALVCNEDLRESMGRKNYELIHEWTLENMGEIMWKNIKEIVMKKE